MKSKNKKLGKILVKQFTLIEVVIAMLVLSIGLVVNFTLISSVSGQVTKAQDEWKHQHMISQAAEYYMLYTKEMDSKPDEVFFPYEGYSAACEHIDEVDDILPEDVDSEKNGWQFVPMKVKLFDNNNVLLQSITIDRILKQNDL